MAAHDPITIPHSRPTLGPEEIKAVSDVIDSGYIAEGQVVQRFEKTFGEYLNIEHAVATSSGTAALHLALLALKIKPEDEVIIPSFVCSALLNAVHYVGACPVAAEIDPVTYNLDPDDVKKRLTGRTKAIIVPHLFGLAADLESLLELNVPLIEDCAQSLGTVYNKRSVGTFGDLAVFSFYATKVITTGEGGMVATHSEKLAACIKDLKTYDKKEEYKPRFNYKMTDIQAALGLTQLTKLKEFILRRRTIARQYDEAFKSLELQLPARDPGHIYYRYTVRLKSDAQPWIQRLSRKNIACNRPIHIPLHQLLGLKNYSVTDTTWKRSISIPIYPSLATRDLNHVCKAFLEVHRDLCG